VFASRLLPLGAVLLLLLVAVLGTARITSGAAPETRPVGDPDGGGAAGETVGDPVGGGAAGEPYRVRAGDTLWQIAVEHYDGDPREAVWEIRERNHLDDALITPGQVLLLP
jgi:nucleoid-associated protein YgaU